MRLTELISRRDPNWADIEVTGLSADSRAVRPGYLFAALKGVHHDGVAFISEAIDNGAVAILAGNDVELPEIDIPVISDANPRQRLARLAAKFHKAQPFTVVAVTGTSGKTSVTVFLRQIWEHMGLPAASLGTIGLQGAREMDGALLTTPDPVELHEGLRRIALDGVQFLAMEASSHGLDQARLDGVLIAAAVFTNLGHDHLDYHGDMDTYFAAKSRLFSELLPTGGIAILNTDDERFATLSKICRDAGRGVMTYGQAPGADVHFEILDRSRIGSAVKLSVLDQELEIWLPLAGDFQVENACAALTASIAVGADPLKAAVVLNDLIGAPGRMELVATTATGAQVFVDYAHKPQGLEKAIEALRPETQGDLWVLFGCGGDRDQAKRPIMGEIAARLSDHVIVSDDNPRSEDAGTIRAEILSAAPNAKEIADRGEAIHYACSHLKAGDTLLIAGKGHETGQYVGDQVIPFDDREKAQQAVAALSGEAA